MKKHNSIFKALLIGALILTGFSCKNNLVTEPTRDGSSGMSSADYGDSIKAPSNVVASQGNYRSVTLTWDTVKNATQYQIFSAETPYDTFIQEGETVGKETSFTVENELPGITKYYLVKAVNFYGTASKGSKIVTATTMDAPIITNITPSSEGTSVSVSWWMGNCTEETYAKDINFVVTAFDSSKNKVPGSETIVEGFVDGKLQDTVVVSNLNPSTAYYFTVEVVKKDSTQKSEKSDFTNAETAHRINPDKVQNLEITQGAYTDKIILSWQLPSPVEYRDRKTMIYTDQPVYFTIKRKVADADDSTYEILEEYIGAYGDSGITFDCSTNSSNNSKLTVEKDETGITPSFYQKYTSLSKIVYTDTYNERNNKIERGKKYTYLIQSYTDQAAEQNTSEESSVEKADGWRLSLTTFKLNSIPSVDETGDIITKVDVNFSLDFNPFDVSYTYILTEDRTEFNAAVADNNERVIFVTNNISDINSSLSSVSFDNPSDSYQQGKYVYKLYIINSTEEDITAVPSEYIEVLKAADEVTVTNDAHAIPKIENFEVKDGYKNKFILTWDEIASTEENPVTYTVSWTSFVNGTAQDEESVILQSTDSKASGYYTVSDGKVTYTVPAESGESRQFTLKAIKNGIPDTKTFDAISKTLGTAKPVMTPAQYKSITVKWDAVQMADTDYVITAKYSDNTNAIAEEPVITTDENGIVTCTIENPVGYDDITMSGLPVSLTVKSINTTTGDYTEAPITVRTLGPALVNTTANTDTIFENRIQMSWDKVEDATGYVIYRTKYFYNKSWTNWEFERADTYFYDASNDSTGAKGTISNNGSAVSASRVKVTLVENKYTLTDYDCDQTDITSSYEGNQAQISWGIPFGYVVIPVNGDKDDFTFGGDTQYLFVTGGKSGVIYKNAFTDKKTATYGYGLNIQADKATDAKTQKVTWLSPYFKDKKPTLYRRLAGTNNNWKRVDPNFETSENSITGTYDPKGTDIDATALKLHFTEEEYLAYDYAVKYGNSTGNTTSIFPNAYLNYLSSTLETGTDYIYMDKSDIETANKGYLLAIPFNASFGGSIKDGLAIANEYQYSEKVEIEHWDYETRKIGPDTYEIYIYNTDTANEWYKVSSFNKDISQSQTETLTDTTIETDGPIVRLWPTNIKTTKKGISSGPLKVIRDGKHYYKLVLNRTGLSKPAEIGTDLNIFGYRDITNEELTKAAMYAFAYGFYRNDGGNENLDNCTTQFGWGNAGTSIGESGSATFSGKWYHISTKYRANYSFSGYAPKLLTPSGKYVTSIVKVSCDTKEVNIRGAADPFLFEFLNTHEISVDTGDPNIDLKYEGTISFYCPNNNTITLKLEKNGTTETMVETKDNATRKRWFPMQIHGDKGYLFTSKDYGWWN